MGSLKLDTGGFEWFAYDRAGTPRPHAPRFRTLTLWDGGVYDNLGVEALFKPAGAYRAGFDFLIVSDASAPLELETRTLRAPLRLLDVATDQVRGLRARAVVSHLRCNPGTGVYLKMGNTQEHIYREANRPAMAERIVGDSLRASEVQEAANIGTTLRRCTIREYDLLFSHGHQVADATLSGLLWSHFRADPTGYHAPRTAHLTYGHLCADEAQASRIRREGRDAAGPAKLGRHAGQMVDADHGGPWCTFVAHRAGTKATITWPQIPVRAARDTAAGRGSVV